MPTDEPQYVGGGQGEFITTPLVYARQVLKEPVIGLFCNLNVMNDFVKVGDYNLPPVKITFLPTPENIRLLGEFTYLVNLDLFQCNLGKQHVDSLIYVLERVKHLQSLSLAQNFLGKDMNLLAPALVNLGSLTSLDLAGVLPDPDFFVVLPRLPRLTRLVLASNYILQGNSGLRLADSLRQFCGLIYLDLHNNELDEAGYVAIEALAGHKDMEYLNLSETHMGPKYLSVLTSGLQGKAKLKGLELSDNLFGDMNCRMTRDNTIALASLLESLPTLELLDLDHIRIADDVAETIIPALRNHRSLKRLSLRGNQISFRGHKALEQVLGDLGSLEVLMFDQGGCTNYHNTSGLYEVALKHPSLMTVDLWPDLAREKDRHRKYAKTSSELE